MNQSAPLDVQQLYGRYGRVVLHRIRRFYSAQEAEDVLQEVFVRVIDKADTFQGNSSPTTWLYQLTTRYCLNRLRDSGRRQQLWQEHGDLSWSRPVSAADQDRKALLNELWRQLPEDIVTIGIYYHLDGMGRDEIAAIVGCSPRTVTNRLQALTAAAQALAGGAA